MIADVAAAYERCLLPAGPRRPLRLSTSTGPEITHDGDYSTLLSYMEGSAAVIGTMMPPLLQPPHPRPARGPFRQLDVAFQPTNVIRDLAADPDRGRARYVLITRRMEPNRPRLSTVAGCPVAPSDTPVYAGNCGWYR